MIQRNDLATKALVKTVEEGGFEPTNNKPVTLSCLGASSSMLSNSATKRSSLLGSFDMGDFLKASEQVEETIGFPSVEWPSLDDADSDCSSDDDNSYSTQSPLTRSRDDRNNDEEYFNHQTNRRKRQCRGLTRCSRSCDLSSLWKLSASSERAGSFGSLS